ncbi:MAG TPA: carboxypeptidase-like regulatory domain-containing protein [Pirellulales bacterium]
MKRFQLFQYAATALASMGLMLPTRPAVAAGDNRPLATPAAAPSQSSGVQGPAILDVTLNEGGTLTGQVVNAQGKPLAKTAVSVRTCGNDVAGVATDAEGNFAVAGLRGGVYEVDSAGGAGYFRLWNTGTSPPSAHKGVLIVAGEQVSRGQCCPGDCCPGQCCAGPCGNQCGNPCGNPCGGPGDPGGRPYGRPGWSPWGNPFGGPNGMYVVGTLVLIGAAVGVIVGSINNQEQQSAS